jgi:hypothetical protein
MKTRCRSAVLFCVAALALAATGLDSLAQSPPATQAPAQSPAVQGIPEPPVLTPAICDLPSYLTSSESVLTGTPVSLRDRKTLDILVLGTGSSALSGADAVGQAYPQRLEHALRKRLSGININVSSEIMPRRTAEDVVAALTKLIKDRKPTLVVWQTGTVDAMRNVHADDFRNALEQGIDLLHANKVDVILMNPQYSPRTDTMISASPYIDMMRIVAQQHSVPLFDRYAAMHHWSENGEFDFFGTTRDSKLARRVHDCVGRALALLVIESARLSGSELKVAR